MDQNVEVLFDKVCDEQFWADRDRVKLLIDLYEKYECLWNVTSKEYKNAPRKKAAKGEIGRHFGVSGDFFSVLLH